MKSNTMQDISYNLAWLLGLCCVAWLLFTLKNVGNDPIGQLQKQEGQLILAVSPNDDKPSVEHGLDQAKISLEEVEQVKSSVDNTDSGECSARCSSILSMLDEDLELDDETFNSLQVYAEDIAAYLQDNESKRQHYLQMALTTTDSDKRSFLTDVFKHLPYQQKVEIGESLISSESWRARADGVTLIADHDIANLGVANKLMDIFSSEENPYVKGRILNYLKQSSTLQGDAEILQQLDSVIYNGTDSSARVAALNAKMHLSEQPYHILPDAVQALRTSEPEFQLAGLIALEQILQHEHKYKQDGVYIGRDSIRNDIQNIRDLVVYDGDMKRFDHLIREANTIYLRYFEY